MPKGDFGKKYWAYRKSNPESKLTMKEYRDTVYKNETQNQVQNHTEEQNTNPV